MAAPRQFVLPLPERVSLAREDYFVSTSNQAAVTALEAWPRWPGGMLALIGPAGSGKTHLVQAHLGRVTGGGEGAALWPDKGRHLVVEDVDRIVGVRAREEWLFHAFNRAKDESGSILFTARIPLAGWHVVLPDLATRLNTVVTADLPPPDDALFLAVLLKLFADRQIDPVRAAEVSSWLAPRIERSLAEAARIVAELDARSLAEKRRIDTRMAADLLTPETGTLL
jgi:chromosomal replication initiation ATPase DnaA